MDRRESYLRSIRHTFPDLDISSVEYNDRGQNSDIVVINSQFIFRFPRYAHALQWLKTETAVLRSIQGHVALAVPVATFVKLDPEVVGEAFVSYRKIPGEPLWRETFHALSSERTVDLLAEQLATFLSALHTIPHEQLAPCGLPRVDTREAWMDMYLRIQEKLFRFMRPDAREWAVNHFETFLAAAGNLKYEPAFRHGDFGPTNILFDQKTQRITGILDFGSCGLGDPAVDFAGLLSGYGEGLLARCGRHYPEIDKARERIRFYRGTFALEEALFGVENDDEAALRAGLQCYV
jgi:aminoglycoside 2''-phosphotransferase